MSKHKNRLFYLSSEYSSELNFHSQDPIWFFVRQMPSLIPSATFLGPPSHIPLCAWWERCSKPPTKGPGCFAVCTQHMDGHKTETLQEGFPPLVKVWTEAYKVKFNTSNLWFFSRLMFRAYVHPWKFYSHSRSSTKKKKMALLKVLLVSEDYPNQLLSSLPAFIM